LGAMKDAAPAYDPTDEDEDLYGALAVREGPWFMQDEDGTLRPITRDRIAETLAWRRRLAERNIQTDRGTARFMGSPVHVGVTRAGAPGQNPCCWASSGSSWDPRKLHTSHGQPRRLSTAGSGAARRASSGSLGCPSSPTNPCPCRDSRPLDPGFGSAGRQ
jgi:hypothetical protein